MSEHSSEHKHHVMPLWIYLSVAGALLILTGVTVGAAYIPFSEFTGIGSLNFVVAMLIASFKATLVALFFMHLLYDNKLYLFALASGVGCLIIFIVITMFDTERRGDVNIEQRLPIIEQTEPERFVIPKKHKGDVVPPDAAH
jgi:cytochrome c oxidase subunit 4